MPAVSPSPTLDLENLRLLKVGDVAARLNCSASTVYQLVESGQLGSHRVGARRGGVRVSEAQLLAYLAACSSDALPVSGAKQSHLKHIRLPQGVRGGT